ncbi:SIR2 family protein [Psychrobacillus sp. OK032]|uniref:SIR2 family protein n=1 Tax=Psychrobacillus sp. OK032 TaxID=1884358 RepID=UPI0008BED02C|nr:SIR2 family protein [Psychrobacillus sp. OK032]SES17807.1 SIR2-like domain-containing protein [Psychrobacillus sp. OK032]
MNKEAFDDLLPENLYQDIVNKSCGFFIGAGISCNAPTNLPGWKKLLKDFIRFAEKNHKLDKNIIDQLQDSLKNNKLLEVAEYLQGTLKEDYTRYLMQVFDNALLTPNRNHEILAQIESPLFITTNYDRLLENSIIKNGKNPIVSTALKSDLLEQIHKVTQRKKILKIHGDINDTKSLVLSETDYMDILSNTTLDVIIKSFFHRNTFIFIGCSMTDPDILIFLKQLKSIFNGYSPTHYALIKQDNVNEIDKYIYKNIYNIEFLCIEDYDDVTSFLEHALATQESSNKNKFEVAIEEHGILNYFEYLLDQLEYYIDVEIGDYYYDSESNYPNINSDINMYEHIYNIFEDFNSQELTKSTLFPYEEFIELFNGIKRIKSEVIQLPIVQGRVKEQLCDSINYTNNLLEDFVKRIKGYIRLRRVRIDNEIINTEFTRTMLEVYEKNYSK